MRGGFDIDAWLAENKHIWDRFYAEANRVWAKGRPHYSARTIIEYMRHETTLREKGEEFKINNTVAPYLARLYVNMHPERAAFFNLREHHG